MKKLKKFVSLLTAVAICALLPGANTLTVSAAEPTTYCIKYTGADCWNGWEFQTGSWSDYNYNRDPYYMFEEIKDGDCVVIDSNDTDEVCPDLNFSVNLSSVTSVAGTTAVVSAPYVDTVYVNNDGLLSITAKINEANVYDHAGLTFYGDVNTVRVVDYDGEANGDVGSATGTVGHMVYQTQHGDVYYEIFNVASGKLHVEYAELLTDSAYYSKTPVANQAPVQAPTAAAPAPAPQKPSAADEYDDVPKTGETGNSTIILLAGVVVACLLGKRALKRS